MLLGLAIKLHNAREATYPGPEKQIDHPEGNVWKDVQKPGRVWVGVLLSPLADCYPPKWAQSVIRYGYPSLHMSSGSAYRRYWLGRLNVHVRRSDPSCPDRNTRIDAS